ARRRELRVVRILGEDRMARIPQEQIERLKAEVSLERLAEALWQRLEKGPLTLSPDLAPLIGSDTATLAAAARRLGFQADEQGLWRPRRARKGPAGKVGPAPAPTDPHSPFARLKDLFDAGR
ncbi:MAG: hypothetical protein ACPGNT_02100, partial [Rhodospirillales bacterium]